MRPAGTAADPAPRLRPYRRRRTRPILTTVAVLAAIAVLTWTIVFVNAGGTSRSACNAPATGSPGTVLAAGALDEVTPVSPAQARSTVLNAGGQRGQANLVAAQLGDLGFAQAGRPGNDPLFPDGDLECAGQLRFGDSGRGAAATLALVLPCLELVRDDRPTDTVDVAVGTAFPDVNPKREVRDVLERLGAPGSGETADGRRVAQPMIDPEELAAARSGAC